jgi:hypothetical protein
VTILQKVSETFFLHCTGWLSVVSSDITVLTLAYSYGAQMPNSLILRGKLNSDKRATKDRWFQDIHDGSSEVSSSNYDRTKAMNTCDTVGNFPEEFRLPYSNWPTTGYLTPLKLARPTKDPWQMLLIPEFELG